MIFATRTTENMGSKRVERGIVEDALCPRGSFRRAGLGAERHKRTVTGLPCHWRRPAVATNGGGSHFLHLTGRGFITGLGASCMGVEPHFIPSPTQSPTP